MVLRTAKTGKNSGQQFWGCSTYPNCKGVAKV
jgi:restriction system protein